MNKLLNLNSSEFEEPVQKAIQDKQEWIIKQLVEKLGSDEIEDQMSASTILCESIDNKEYFKVVSQRETLGQLFDIAFSHVNEECRKIGIQIICNLLDKLIEKHRHSEKKEDTNVMGGDDDEAVVQTSDDESTPESQEEKNIATILANYIGNLPELLSKAPGYTVEMAMNTEQQVPLGVYRGRLVQLIHSIVKLNKEELNDELVSNDIFKTLTGLIPQHPWNNFFQLNIINIYEFICQKYKAQAREKAIKNSKLVDFIAEMNSDDYRYKFESTRTIRAGYMGMINKISNLINDASFNQDVSDILAECNSWAGYVKNELTPTNETHAKRLGGQEPKPPGGDEDETNFDSMDQIMTRFSNFSSRSSAQENQDDDDDNNEEDEFDSQNNQDDVTENASAITEDTATGLIEVKIEDEEKNEEFFDNQYWKKPLQYDISELDLSDFE